MDISLTYCKIKSFAQKGLQLCSCSIYGSVLDKLLGLQLRGELATVLEVLFSVIKDSSDTNESYFLFDCFLIIFGLSSLLFINVFVVILLILLASLLLSVCMFTIEVTTASTYDFFFHFSRLPVTHFLSNFKFSWATFLCRM